MDDRHEVLREIIDLYVDSSRIERIVLLWERKLHRRAQLYEELIHDACWFRDDRSTELRPQIEDPAHLAATLRTYGFGPTCLIYGEYDYRDPAQQAGMEVALTEHMPSHGGRNAALFYCPKSKVAFLEGHSGNQLILHLKPPRKTRA